MTYTHSTPHLHTYKIMRVEMLTTERPLRFSDGERIVQVLETSRVPLTSERVELLVLVELPIGLDEEA